MWRWLFGRREAGRDVVLYTRQGCHLCDDAWQVLLRARDRFGCALRQIDVDTDPALAQEYGQWVPVVTIDGRVHFRGRVNAVLLARVLRGGT